MKVKIYFKEDSPYGEIIEVLENITEIHYNYPSHGHEVRVAFENDIDGTGYTYVIDHIREFEAK
jgi:hypothetical protein